MASRLAYLDIIRCLAVTLVMYGHLVIVGAGALEIPLVVGQDVRLPILQNAWPLQKLEIAFINNFQTQTAILGVTLFFITTGYLIPIMMERYSRLAFLANRFFRIFPVLFVGLGFITVLIATQGIEVSLISFLSSITLTYLFVGALPVTGVLWTLVAEVIFYLISAALGRWTIAKYLFLLASLFFVAALVSESNTNLSVAVAFQIKALFFISVGSAIYLAEREQKMGLLVFGCIIAYFGIVAVHLTGKLPVPSSYNNHGNFLTALGIFLLMRYVAPQCPRWLSFYADLVYPIYLVHVPLGLITMLWVRDVNADPCFMLTIAIVFIIVVSILLNRLVEQPLISFGSKLRRKSAVY